MEKVNSYKDLLVWQKSIDFVEKIYLLTRDFPKDEMYGLISQIRRSAVSISSNIAEGAARQSRKEFIQFLYIALGSCAEIETQLIISIRLNYLDESILPDIEEIGKMINGLIKSLKNQIN